MDIVQDIYIVEFGHSAGCSRNHSGLGTLDEERTSDLEAAIRYFEYAFENNIMNWYGDLTTLKRLHRQWTDIIEHNGDHVFMLSTSIGLLGKEPRKIFGSKKDTRPMDQRITKIMVSRDDVHSLLGRIRKLIGYMQDRLATKKYLLKFVLE